MTLSIVKPDKQPVAVGGGEEEEKPADESGALDQPPVEPPA
jgi:hypothetical protein